MAMSREELVRGVVRRLVQVVLGVVVWGVLAFAAAGTLDWPQAWAYLGLTPVLLALNFAWLWRSNPEVIAARSKTGMKGTKGFDKVMAPLFLACMIGVPVVAGLDLRWDWAPLPWWTLWVGAALVVLGNLPIAWSMAHNPHLEKTVRIQEDRDHQVATTGPYALVRHPMYVGVCLQYLGMPLMVGRAWAFTPALAMCLVLVVRTAFEDATLQRELPGYAEFARDKTRYRLVPGVW